MNESNVSNDTQPVRLPPRHPWLNRKRRAMGKGRQMYVEPPAFEFMPAPAAEPRITVKRKRRLVFD
ncbi:hypothetical protein DPV79_40475 [Burkholderia reimsis]|uniref:Uncharacterized protein n=1 Tax=Burkholderia reimsis TaxID=2234132 RepID=A0A365QGR6_9BURK|nr:hypothetical protein DPV79_40475 [Burkholderia reimsis]